MKETSPRNIVCIDFAGLGPQVQALKRLGHGKMSAFVKEAFMERWEKKGRAVMEQGIQKQIEELQKAKDELEDAERGRP